MNVSGQPTAPATTRVAAFFDLDRTIISGASTFALGITAWRHGLLAGRDLIGDAASALAFRLTGGSDERSEATRDRILQGVAGRRAEELQVLGDDLLPTLLEKVRPEARNLLDMHAAAGRDRYIVSAAPVEIIEPFAASLGLDGAIATRSEIVDGAYTGRLDGPFVYGAGKAEAIEKLAAERGYDLRLCYAYSDSISDLPMLELVGHPVAVNPDRMLQSVAYQRGWPIVVFSRRVKRAVKTTSAMSGAAGLAGATYLLGRRHGRLAAEAQQGRLLASLRRSPSPR